MHDIRSLIGRLIVMANERELGRKVREGLLGAAALFRRPGAAIRETLDGIGETAAIHDREVASWIEPGEITKGGPFDACDLRHWLEIARPAAVGAVPAREILTLSEDELSAVDRKIAIPDFVQRRLARGLERAFTAEERAGMNAVAEERERPAIDPQQIVYRLFAAMDDVPANWMVRSNICGPSTLKAMAGAGLIGEASMTSEAEASWSPPRPRHPGADSDLEIGPGWVRHGNRRRVDATDQRFVSTGLGGHKPRLHYLARPWVRAARRNEGPDPHRHGTPFAGKGSWPCEWRVFVENGVVTGVASYYGWSGQATPLDARRALEAVGLARRMVETMARLKLAPRFAELEMLRAPTEAARVGGAHLSEIHPDRLALLARYPLDGITCTLDFIEAETDDGPGMLLLEGGPGHTPLGGGHPCAFAGHGVDGSRGAFSLCEGVALRLLEGVVLADPASWKDAGSPEGRILSWREAEALAAECA